jgi:hypothetical protein
MPQPEESTESRLPMRCFSPFNVNPNQVEMGVMQAEEQRMDQEWEMENQTQVDTTLHLN